MKETTVSAISTPRGKGGIAVIRISGAQAAEIADRVFHPLHGGAFSAIKARTATYGTIERNGETIDDGIAVLFRAPNSFTGEDVVEISCHGGAYVAKAVLEATFSAGAEPAGPGEFTKRAYLNGKLSLSRAEGIGNLLDARTDAQMRLASAGARGKISEKIEAVREKLLVLIATVHAAIDYPDEEVPEVGLREMQETLASCAGEIDALSATYHTGRAVAEGIRTVICGQPNAGKSSLYNALLGEERAIVTDVAGTTRDVLEDCVSLGDATLLLSDTAGLRKTDDTVEKIGVERAKEKIAGAELILAVADATDETSLDAIADLPEPGQHKIVLINKCDVAAEQANAMVKDGLCHADAVIKISAKTGMGMDILEKTVSDMFVDGTLDLTTDAVISSSRQYAALTRAADAMRDARTALADGQPYDIIAFEAERALCEIGMVEGSEVSEEIVSEIFSRFCVGK